MKGPSPVERGASRPRQSTRAGRIHLTWIVLPERWIHRRTWRGWCLWVVSVMRVSAGSRCGCWRRRAGGAGARQVPGQRQDGRTHLLDIGGGYEADLAVCAAVIILELCLPPAAWV